MSYGKIYVPTIFPPATQFVCFLIALISQIKMFNFLAAFASFFKLTYILKLLYLFSFPSCILNKFLQLLLLYADCNQLFASSATFGNFCNFFITFTVTFYYFQLSFYFMCHPTCIWYLLIFLASESMPVLLNFCLQEPQYFTTVLESAQAVLV